jgi:uncharacterized peroxidase-related enzyme
MVCWIKTIPYEDSQGELREIYDRVRLKGRHGIVYNLYRAQSLRPQTLESHDTLYRSVLHSRDNKVAKWFLEVVATYTAILNGCQYASTHHFTNARQLMADDARADDIFSALSNDRPQDAFGGKELAFLDYTRKLTLSPNQIVEIDIETLRAAGADDEEILEINQVCASFNYSTRVINGLGVELGDDVIGLYPEG